jgi:hypothetical protein
MGLFMVAIFFPMSIFLHEYSFISSLFGSLLGACLGSYLYYLMMKKSTFLLIEEIERGFQATIIPESRFESYVEIGEYFNKKSGKIFITDDYLIFKPNRFNNSANQPFDKIPLRDISSVSVEKPFFFGDEKIKMAVHEKHFVITSFEECADVVKYLKSA